MALRLVYYIVMRSRLIFVVVRFLIIFSHREIFKLVPHQNSAETRIKIEAHSIQNEPLALLKLCAAPEGGEGRKPHLMGSTARFHSHDEGALLKRDQITRAHACTSSPPS